MILVPCQMQSFFFSSMIENFVLKFVMICGGLLDLLYNMLSVSKEQSKFD